MAIRIFLTVLKLFMMLMVTAMILFQIPELRYDFSEKKPVLIKSADELSIERFAQSTFASVEGKGDFSKAATFAKHGVRANYFLLDGFDGKLVVSTYEPITGDWEKIDLHVGRLRPYDQMPFSRSVRAGFSKLFDIQIGQDAFFLARDDVPSPSGWTIGAFIFASILWCVLAYFFFIHSRLRAGRAKKI